MTGWTITRAGELLGFVPSVGWHASQLEAWLAAPIPGFVFLFLITRDVSEIPSEDLAALIPADTVSTEARRLVASHLEPGSALHLT